VPTYEYACKECGEHLDVQQSFTDAALTECPNCGGPLRKVFGNIAITFKGSGFYKTDSRKTSDGGSKAGDGAKSETGATSSESSSPTSDGTTKPAEKSPVKEAKAEKKAEKAPATKAAS